MFILKFFNFSKNLIYIIRFLVVLLSLFSFSNYAAYMSLDDNNLYCFENSCDVLFSENQLIRINEKDSRIFELLQKNVNKKESFIGYLFYTTDMSDLVAYSGKPLEILIFLKLDGVIEDLKLIKHSEPILLTGIPIEKLLEAVCFYKGKNIKDKITIGEGSSDEISVPIIAGATVTSLILHETVLGISRNVGMILGIIDNLDLRGSLTKDFKKYSWNQLVKIGAINHYCLDSLFRENIYANKNDLLVDIYFADLRHPSIGRNLLGDSVYFDFVDNDLKDNESFIIILNNGRWSFKGSGFVRGGIFDRFHVEQNTNVFTIRDNDFRNVYDLNLVDIEDFREAGIFLIKDFKYIPWKKWDLVLLLNYKTFHITYEMPVRFCIVKESNWLKSWKIKLVYIYGFLFLGFLVIFVFLFRNEFSKNAFFLSAIYNFILILDIYVIGFLLEGQPSIVNFFVLVDNLNIKALFFDPVIVLGWFMILSTVFIWGKALFCGWICPFGAFQEVLFKLRSLLIKNDVSLEFSIRVSNKLRYLRYVFLIILLVMSFINIHQAEYLAEIEPFKTVWNVGILNRPKYISLYAVLLLFTSLFMYRFFCRFLCPLGALLSFLSVFIILKLRRRGTCVVCRICEHSCNSRAIDKFGFVDSKECFGCFTCLSNMYNLKICPPYTKKLLRVKYEAKRIWWN